MPITFRHEFLCECDMCSEILELDEMDTNTKHPTPRTFKPIAKKMGWHIWGNNCLCATCYTKPLPTEKRE